MLQFDIRFGSLQASLVWLVEPALRASTERRVPGCKLVQTKRPNLKGVLTNLNQQTKESKRKSKEHLPAAVLAAAFAAYPAFVSLGASPIRFEAVRFAVCIAAESLEVKGPTGNPVSSISAAYV